MTTVLGISALDKNVTAALVVDGRIVKVVMEERLTRVKQQAGFPARSIEALFRETGLSPRDVDVVTYPFFRWQDEGREKVAGYLADLQNVRRQLGDPPGWIRHQAYYLGWLGLTTWSHRQWNVALKRGLRESGLARVPLVHVPHHAAHAASAYFCSRFDRALVATFDWYGSGLGGSVWLGEGGRMRLLKRIPYPHSLGLFYAQVTKALGFKWSRHEGKVVGLAAFGDPGVLLPKVMERFQQTEGDFRYLRAMDFQAAPKLAARYSREDVAAAYQTALERVVVELLRPYVRQHDVANVVLAGGVAANVKLNQRVHEMDGVHGTFIHPAMGDDGTSVGGALYWLSKQGQGLQPTPLKDVYLGNGLDARETEAAVRASGLPFEHDEQIERRIAALVAEGKVVARVTGASEYGPRALGHRSILCSARDASINDWLNARLQRSEFMPFAPITLYEARDACYQRIAGAEHAARFMTITFDCTAEMREQAPAAVHVDGTARPQLVEREVSPGLHALLTEYQRLTGSPSLVNTSFNMHEEPIVASADDAIRTFVQGGLDYLALDRFLISRPGGGVSSTPRRAPL
ncbi:MAG: carbamoyltransferase C-terminal domain-containing protein [Chloroflexota bacterium]